MLLLLLKVLWRHRQFKWHLHPYNHSQRRNNLLNKISSLNHKLSSLRLMVMHPHRHQIKRHLINSRQRISHHLKIVLQLMRLMVKQRRHLSKQLMILLHLRPLRDRQQAMHLLLLQLLHPHRSLHQQIMQHLHRLHLQLQRKCL